MDRRIQKVQVTREDFTELKNIVQELTEDHRALVVEVRNLAEAQKRTEQTVNKLAEKVDSLTTQVGRLSDNIGYGLEDIARVVLPSYLYKNFNIKIENFERRFFIIDGEEIEINLYGEGNIPKENWFSREIYY